MPGAGQAGNDTGLDRIVAANKYDWNCPRRCFGRPGRCSAAAGEDHRSMTTNEIVRHRRQSIVVAFCPMELDGDILTIDKVCGFQTPTDGIDDVPVRCCRSAVYYADQW